ncbi:phycobiliprotein lyase [Pleurocapsales cyanobacterium LEGE 10410]|nr:phycobiliprotein lyase [Pleurocapsales cyanobacterium LEGE 10410]
MNLQKFLNLSAGRWFSQRTNYFLSENQTDSSKADLTIEFIPPDDPRALKLCQQNHLDPNLVVGGTVQSWDNSVDWGKTKQVGSASIILVGNLDGDHTGKLIRPQDTEIWGRYVLGEDQALTLIVETDEMYAEERQWFASDNFKMRTTVVKYRDGKKQTSFYSEIRKAPPKEQNQE